MAEKPKVSVEVIEEFPACSPDLSRLAEKLAPGTAYSFTEPEFIGKVEIDHNKKYPLPEKKNG